MQEDNTIEYTTKRLSRLSKIAKELAVKNYENMRKNTPQEYREQQKLVAEVRRLPIEFAFKTRLIEYVPCELVYARPYALEERTIIYYHGGSWMFGDVETARPVAVMLSKRTKFKVLVVDYRRAPENKYPNGFNDCYNVYKNIIESGQDPKKIGIFGDSAGGNYSIAVLNKAKEEGLPMPACVGLASPATDMRDESFIVKTYEDLIYSRYNDEETTIFRLYLGDKYYDSRSLPTISPVMGDLSEFPPVLIHSGSSEAIALDNVVFARKMQKEGGDVRLKIWNEMFHDFTIVGNSLLESRESMGEMCDFFKQQMELSAEV